VFPFQSICVAIRPLFRVCRAHVGEKVADRSVIIAFGARSEPRRSGEATPILKVDKALAAAGDGSVGGPRRGSHLVAAVLVAAMASGSSVAEAQTGADFDDLLLAAESFWNGSDLAGEFTSGGATFFNSFNTTWMTWDGWAYSNQTDTTTPGFANQYSAFTGGGQGGSVNYGVAYDSSFSSIGPPTIVPADGVAKVMEGAWLTNTTWAALSMRDGDPFAKQFGGPTGTDPDWFRATITGYDADDNPRGTVEFYLADFRFEDSAEDYIVDEWAWVDMTDLGPVSSIDFVLSSSDHGDFGMNTPAYFALDGLRFMADAPLLGDLNGDGQVDGLDVEPFVSVLVDGLFQAAADMNEDRVVNGLDVDPFVAAVIGGGGGLRAIPEPSLAVLLVGALLALATPARTFCCGTYRAG
jgi:hypothetical protein